MNETARPKRILVVDDEAEVRNLICHLLSAAGYEVEAVSDGGEALKKVAARKPDLVVLDVMLPGVDGLGVLEHLRLDAEPPPVVGLTALDDYETFSRFVRRGAAAYLGKPFRTQDLLEVCGRVLRPRPKESRPPGEERRREPRRELMVGVKVLSGQRSPVVLGELLNLSAGGAQLELVVPVEPGNLVRVALHISGADPRLSFEGRVVWQLASPHGFSHGLAFANMPPEAATRLQELFQPPS